MSTVVTVMAAQTATLLRLVALLGFGIMTRGSTSPQSFWAFYPQQRCDAGGSGGALLRLNCADDTSVSTMQQTALCELVRKCRRSREPQDCRAACLAAGGEQCGGYDTEGRLFASGACTGEFSRVAGTGDLFVRHNQPLQASPSGSTSPKVKHMVVLYMENRCAQQPDCLWVCHLERALILTAGLASVQAVRPYAWLHGWRRGVARSRWHQWLTAALD